jgi:multimeric flavodoxin WrbA
MAGAPSILALAASPRVGGNTDRLLDAFLEPFAAGGSAVTKHYLGRLNIHPCVHCGGCLSGGACVRRDDMDLIYRGLAEAELLVLASPVYFLGVTAQAKAMIDRCQALWVAKYRLGRPLRSDYRPAAFISAAGHNSPGIFECPLKVVRAFFKTTMFKLSSSVLEADLDETQGRELDGAVVEEARRRGAAFMKEVNGSEGNHG